MTKIKEALAFDDILLEPEYSEVLSRLDPNLDTSTIIGGVNLEIPLISSPMDTVTESAMAIAIGKLGGMGVIHRFNSVLEQFNIIERIIDENDEYHLSIPVVPAIGVTEEEKKRFTLLIEEFGDDITMVSVDVANGHHLLMREMIKFIRSVHPTIPIMAGNVATGSGFKFLADLGVNAVRVGIGGGSICKTRIQTGFGVPTLASVLDCAELKADYPETSLIADGGIRYPSDLVKSLVAGADAIIAGGLFAGTKESPGKVIQTNDGQSWKNYRGMASSAVQEERRGGMKPGSVAEGVSQLVPYKGPVDQVIHEFIGGLRAGMSMGNAYTIKDLRKIKMMRITEAGITESHAHGTRK